MSSPSSYIAPVAPPPDIDLEAWERSLDEIEARGPARLCLPHFGVVEDVGDHLAGMRTRLREWAERVRDGATRGGVRRRGRGRARRRGRRIGGRAYTQAGPLWQSYKGLKRYWEKRVTQTAGYLI